MSEETQEAEISQNEYNKLQRLLYKKKLFIEKAQKAITEANNERENADLVEVVFQKELSELSDKYNLPKDKKLTLTQDGKLSVVKEDEQQNKNTPGK